MRERDSDTLCCPSPECRRGMTRNAAGGKQQHSIFSNFFCLKNRCISDAFLDRDQSTNRSFEGYRSECDSSLCLNTSRVNQFFLFFVDRSHVLSHAAPLAAPIAAQRFGRACVRVARQTDDILQDCRQTAAVQLRRRRRRRRIGAS